MDQRILKFNEDQLRKVGFGEAFTEELKAQFEQRISYIKYNFKKEIDLNNVDVTLHLRKSSISDYYTLKKFDLQLQQEGTAQPVKQTFNITDTNFGTTKVNIQHFRDPSRYTLQEAYNLLSGRAVYKHLVNSNGTQEQAWIKLNLRNSGSEKSLFQIKYGFDLARVLESYSIKELKYEKMKHALIQSLHRGNIKKVTFVGAKKHEEELYIYPDINSGFLVVFNKLKESLSTTDLLDKKFLNNNDHLVLDNNLNTRQNFNPVNPTTQKPLKPLIPNSKNIEVRGQVKKSRSVKIK